MTDDVEIRLLGAILDHAAAADIAGAIVRGSEFANPTLGSVYDRLVTLRQQGVVIDADTLPAYYTRWQIPIPEGTPDPIMWSQHDQPAVAADLATIIRNGNVRRLGLAAVTQARAALMDQAVDPFSTLAEHARSVTDVVDSSVEHHDEEVHTLGEVLDMQFTYDWVLPGLLERKDRLVITGNEGSGKSWLIRQLVISASAGLHPFDLKQIEPKKVMVIDTENTLAQWQRGANAMAGLIAQMGRRDPRQHLNIQCRGRLNLRDPKDEAIVHRLVDKYQPDILAIGPLYKLTPGAISTDDDAAPLITVLDGLRERGICLVMEAHAGHAKSMLGEREMRPRGSSALLGWPEFGYGLRPLESDPMMSAVVRWRGDRDERSWPKHVYRGGTLPWTAADF